MHVEMLHIVLILIHCGSVMPYVLIPYGIMNLVKINSCYGLLPDGTKTSLNQFWLFCQLEFTNIFYWNFIQNSNLFILENAFENVSIFSGLNVLINMLYSLFYANPVH